MKSKIIDRFIYNPILCGYWGKVMIKKKCPDCDKEIEGYTEKQVDHMIAQHILAKHQKGGK